MALPILDTATYELTLPSSDVQVKYRPFLVKEEKILLLAMESENAAEITKALKEIVHTCTFGSINVEALPTFDLEYIFLNIRAKSVGEVAKLKLLCPDDKETYANVELDLSKVEVQVDDKHSNEIQINDKIKMVMKYPTINSFDPTVDATKLKTEQLFDIIADTVYEIYDGETVHKGSDYSKEEMKKFIESLNILIEDYNITNFQAIILGSDQGRKVYSKKLINLVERYNLNKKIRFISHCKEMPLAYSLADVVVSASIEPEAFGRVSVEAQSMGKPIVASNIGGSKETIVNKKTGFLYKHDDPRELAKNLNTVIQLSPDELKNMGNEGRKNITKKFDVETMCQSNLKEYRRLIKN